MIIAAGACMLAMGSCSKEPSTEEPQLPFNPPNGNSVTGGPVMLWNKSQMEAAREDLWRNNTLSSYWNAYNKLLQDADELLDATPTTVMDDIEQRQIQPEMMGATKHDFMNSSKYVWPDGNGWFVYDETQGVNNDWKLYSSTPQSTLQSRLVTLGMAYYFSQMEKYAKKAVELADAWYINPLTRMNPNYLYGVVRPVANQPGEWKTEASGLINCDNQSYAIAGLSLIRGSKAYTPEFDAAMKSWVSQLYNWLKTHQYGVSESKANNNHGVVYDHYMLTFALFTGDTTEAKRIIAEFPEKRIFKQIEPDGEMPAETKRESGYHYSWYCLRHFVQICDLAMDIDPELYYKEQGGRSIDNAVKFTNAYLGKTREDWLAAGFKEYADGTFENAQAYLAWVAYRAHKFSPGSGHMAAFERQKAQHLGGAASSAYNKNKYRFRDTFVYYLHQ